jgi:hypothetical protein
MLNTPRSFTWITIVSLVNLGLAFGATATAGPSTTVPGAPAPVTPTPVAPSTAGGDPCPEWGCGANSPQVDSFRFHDLRLRSNSATALVTEANAQGIAIRAQSGRAAIHTRSCGVCALAVHGGALRAECPVAQCGRTTLTGADLIGAWFELVVPPPPGPPRPALPPPGPPRPGLPPARLQDQHVVIEERRPITFFTASVPAGEAYVLRLGERNLCNRADVLPSEEPLDELMGLHRGEAVVFEGERFDATHMTMTDAVAEDWINLGCAGHTLSKMWLTRNTVASWDTALPARGQDAWRHRQATLKLLVADYCGTGAALTVNGQHLDWRGDGMTYFSPPTSMEAEWDEHGALCLSVPRLKNPTDPSLARQAFPNGIQAAIRDACGAKMPPSCQHGPAANTPWPPAVLRVSANR